MTRTSITITDEQDDWIDMMVEGGAFQNRSEVIRFCINNTRGTDPDTDDRLAELEQKIENTRPMSYKAYHAIKEKVGLP